MRLFGPAGFVDRVGHRLAAYTWNLVENYPTDFTVVATEVHEDGTALSAEFHCLRRFVREGEREFRLENGILLDDPAFTVTTSFLDHRTPSLAFTIEEKQHVNIMKNRLEEAGLPVGAWLTRLKQGVVRQEDPETLIPVPVKGAAGERPMRLGDLQDAVVQIVRGQKITYVTDAVYSDRNEERIVSLARGADYLFIESTFLHEEVERAAEKCHLTARQAGEMARAAGVARVVPFHFSAKYKGEGERLERELEEAYAGR
jgi:ribonuclease Z